MNLWLLVAFALLVSGTLFLRKIDKAQANKRSGWQWAIGLLAVAIGYTYLVGSFIVYLTNS